MATPLGARLPAAPWLRRPGPGALLGPLGALFADVRRGQHAGRILLHAGELFSHPATAVAARGPQAADPDDAEVASAPQALRVAPRRPGRGYVFPSVRVGRCGARRRWSTPRGGRQDPPCGPMHRKGLL